LVSGGRQHDDVGASAGQHRDHVGHAHQAVRRVRLERAHLDLRALILRASVTMYSRAAPPGEPATRADGHQPLDVLERGGAVELRRGAGRHTGQERERRTARAIRRVAIVTRASRRRHRSRPS
jgi:hypothetical protein